MTNTIDTADYIDENDFKALDEIQRIKKLVLSYFKNESLVEMIKTTIEESKYIDFPNKRMSRVNPNRPAFIVKYNAALIKSEYDEDFNNSEDSLDILKNIVYTDMIAKYNDYITNSIKNLDESVKNDIFKSNDSNFISNLSEDSISSFITSIFTLRFELNQNLIYVEYFR